MGDQGSRDAHLIVCEADINVVPCLAFQIFIMGHNHNPIFCYVAIEFKQVCPLAHCTGKMQRLAREVEGQD